MGQSTPKGKGGQSAGLGAQQPGGAARPSQPRQPAQAPGQPVTATAVPINQGQTQTQAQQPQQQLSVEQLEQQIAQLKQQGQGQQQPQQGQGQQKAQQSPPNAGLQQRAPSSNRIRGPARAKPCANKPCQNGAMCTNVRSKDGSKPYTCVCKDGWEGPDCATKQASIHLDASMIQKTEDGPLVTPMLRDGKPLEGFAETAPSFPMTSEHVLIELENTGDLALDFQTPVLITENKAVVSPALVGKGRKGGRLGAAKTEGADSGKLKRMSPKRKIEVDHHCLAPGKSSKVMMVVNFANNMNVTFGWTMTCEASAPKGLTVIMKDFDGGKVYEKGAVNPLFSATGKAHVTQTPHFFSTFLQRSFVQAAALTRICARSTRRRRIRTPPRSSCSPATPPRSSRRARSRRAARTRSR